MTEEAEPDTPQQDENERLKANAMPASRQTFAEQKEAGVTGDEAIEQVFDSFDRVVSDFMATWSEQDLSLSHRWNLISFAVALENSLRCMRGEVPAVNRSDRGVVAIAINNDGSIWGDTGTMPREIRQIVEMLASTRTTDPDEDES